MKIQAINISSGILAIPAPISVTLASGKSITVSMTEQQWRAVQTSPAFLRLMQAKMLSMISLEPKVEAPAPKADEPKPAQEAPKSPEPEAKADEPKPEPAEPEAKADEPKPENKKKRKPTA